MRRKKWMAAAMAAGMMLTMQPAWAEEAQTEAMTENAQARVSSEELPDASDTAVQAQKLDTYYTLALNAISSQDYETADKYLDICFAFCDPQTNPELYADLLLKRACIDVINGEADMALNELDAALRMQPELADAYLVRTQVYTAQGDIDHAIENLEKYISLTKDTSLYQTVAQLHEANGDLDQAADAYGKYVEGSEDEIQEAGFQNGLYRMEGGKYEEAIEAFEAYADDETYGAGAMYNIGICRMNLGEYDKAVEAFTSCEEKGGDFDGLYYNRGVCSLLAESWESAAEDFEKSIETESYVADAQYNLGICRMQQEDYEGAIDVFTKLIGDGRKAKTEAALAETEAENASAETEAEEAPDETEADTSQAEASDVQTQVNPGAYYYRAACEGAVGRLDEAIEDYTWCIENGYELSQSYYQRAQVYAAQGDTEKQTSDLESSLKAAQ